MLSRYLICALCAAGTVFSSAIPSLQAPLLSVHAQHPAKSAQTTRKCVETNNAAVVLVYKRRGEDHESTIHITLGQPVKGSMLHTHPFNGAQKDVSSMVITSVLGSDLAQVRCRITPKFSLEEDWAARAAAQDLDVSPTFGAEDGIVILDRAESRWFLAGRRIESVECW